jgi:hypothetical protein
MLDSLTAKLGGLPVYLWVLGGAIGLYLLAHHRSTKIQGVAPTENINPKQPGSAPSPVAPVFVYNPAPMGAFGGSSPWNGATG